MPDVWRMSQELESTSPADTLPMLERAGIARTPVTLESTSPADTLQMLEGADIAGALVELKGTSPAECLGEVMAKSDNCGSVTARILAKRDALVRRHRPDPLAPGPVRTADLKDPFEWELFAVLKKGGLELVRCLADQARKTGDVLIPIELSEPAASLVKDLWLHTGCNPLLGLGIDGLDGTPDRLEKILYDAACVEAGDLPNPERSLTLPPRPDFRGPEKSGIVSPPGEPSINPHGGGQTIEGMANDTMDKPTMPIPTGLLAPGTEEDKRAKKATEPNRKARADLEQRRRHQKWVADLQASYDRRLGVPIGVAQYQEKLIRDARTYATSYLLEAPSQVAQLRVTRLALTELGITPNTEKFPLSFEALHKAIWTEGNPSLEELANEAGEDESADTQTRPVLSGADGAVPAPAKLSGKGQKRRPETDYENAQGGELPASTQRTVAEESRSAAPAAETGATLLRRGYFIQGIARGAMGGSVIDGIQSWVEEADCRTLVKLCKAIDPAVDDVDVCECIETYILERFDNVAVGFLEIVTGTQTIDEYMAILKEWCDSVLPALERDFKVDEAAVRRIAYEATVPRLVDEATFRRIEEVVGTTGRVMGSVDMRKLAERAAEWRAKAISRARGIETGLSRIHSKRLRGAKTRDCLRAAYDLYPSGLDVLTEEFLSRAVPRFVFAAAVDHKWVRHPPIRPTSETRSQNDLTEIFGDYTVPSRYWAEFTRNLESRIVCWRAEARTRAAASDQIQPEGAGGKAPMGLETEAAKPQRATVSPQIVGKKKRGRPQTIPDHKKALALKRKDGGGSNRDAAVIIYSTDYPSPQQVKNVSTILRIYRAKAQKAHSPGRSISAAAKKPSKTKG